MSPEMLQLLLGGTLLTSLGAGIKYLIDLARTSARERSPLGIAASASAAADAAISTMAKVNDELTEANERLTAENARLTQANACLHKSLNEAADRENRLREEVSRLEARVHDLEANIRDLSRDLTTFREQEFPDS